VSSAACEEIAELRRKLQRKRIGHVLFLDETALRLSAAPLRTLVLPHQQPYVVATETSTYAARFDMIACCTSDRVLIPKIFTPSERKGADVKGINGPMLKLLRFSTQPCIHACVRIDVHRSCTPCFARLALLCAPDDTLAITPISTNELQQLIRPC